MPAVINDGCGGKPLEADVERLCWRAGGRRETVCSTPASDCLYRYKITAALSSRLDSLVGLVIRSLAMRQPRSEMITIRVTGTFHLRVRDAAEAEHQTVTAFVINALNYRMKINNRSLRKTFSVSADNDMSSS